MTATGMRVLTAGNTPPAMPFVFLATALEAGASTPRTLGETEAGGTSPRV